MSGGFTPQARVRLAAMLVEALVERTDRLRRQTLAVEAACQRADGGMGLMAIAAISALPPGPRRDFEVASWARRIVDGPETLAVMFTPNMTDAEFEACVDLQVATELERRREVQS